MQLDRLFAVGDGALEVATPDPQQHDRRRQCGHQRILGLAAFQHPGRVVVARGFTTLMVYKMANFLAEAAHARGRCDDAMGRKEVHNNEPPKPECFKLWC